MTLLSASMFVTERGVTPAIDEILTNPASANELCFLQIHGALCMTEDGLCLTVNGSSDLKIASDTLHGDLASHQSMTSPSLSLSKRKC